MYGNCRIEGRDSKWKQDDLLVGKLEHLSFSQVRFRRNKVEIRIKTDNVAEINEEEKKGDRTPEQAFGEVMAAANPSSEVTNSQVIME